MFLKVNRSSLKLWHNFGDKKKRGNKLKKLILSTLLVIVLFGVYNTTDAEGYVNNSNKYEILGLPYIHT